MGSSLEAQSASRLWVPGPGATSGLDELCLSSSAPFQRTTFSGIPADLARCPNGDIYVIVDPNTLARLDPVSGAILSSCLIPGGTVADDNLGCKSDGNLLLIESSASIIREYTPACAVVDASWATTTTSTVRYITGTASGKVLLFDGHPDLDPTSRIDEYDNSGTLLRNLVSSTDGIDSFVLDAGPTLLVHHRDSRSIKRYSYPVSGPSVLMSDFAVDAARLPAAHLAINPGDGTVFATQHQNGCIYAWSAAGSLLSEADPLYCYAPFLNHGRPLASAGPCIPACSTWGVVLLTLLTLAAGTAVLRMKQVQAA